MTGRPPAPTTGREYSISLVVRVPRHVARPEGHRHDRPDHELAGLAIVDALTTAGILTVTVRGRQIPGWVDEPICTCPHHREDHP